MSTRRTVRSVSLALAAFAAAAVGTLTAARALAAVPGWEGERRLSRNGADSMTSINFARSVALDEAGRLHVVWIDHRDGNSEVYYKRSLDAGVSWGPPIRLSADPGMSFNPSVAATGEVVHVVWQEVRAQGSHVYYRRSTDGGIRWQPERTITIDGAGSPSVAVEGSSVHVVYGRPSSPDDSDIFYVRSLDAGGTWEDEMRISALPFHSWTPTIAAAEGHVYVAWTDTSDAIVSCCQEEEYFAFSEDGGLSWSAPVRLTVDPPEAMANSWAPSLAASGPDVWIVWFDERSGGWEIYTKRSRDYGRSWSEDRRLTFSDGAAMRPSIARRGSELYVAYWDHPPGQQEEIYLLRSGDRGESWDPPQRLTHAPGSSILPSVAAGDHGVHVVWSDGRDGNGEVYHTRLPGQEVELGNGLIAFTREVGGAHQIFTVGPDGGGERQLTFVGENTYPAWSKDGSRLLFSSDRSGSFELWVMEPDGSNPAPVTVGGGNDFTPDYSYDGTRIAFASVRGGVPHPEIWIVNVDGSDPTRLTFAPPGSGGSVHPSFSPGDATIYFGSGMSGSAQVWGMVADGRGLEQKTHGLGPSYPEANVPEWSRGGVLTFWSGFEGQFGEVWSWDLESGAAPARRTETPDPRSSDNPSWSPDGRKILFDSNRGGSPVSVWVVDADGSNPRELIPGASGQTAWQPVTGGSAGGGGTGGGGEPFTCLPSATEMCLNRGRFEVRVTWRDFQGGSGPGRVVPVDAEDSGLFWFFDDDNWELLVKVLDGCALNSHYWVFAAATTNVGYTLTVIDSETGEPSEYENALGTASPAITDTRAFATCP